MTKINNQPHRFEDDPVAKALRAGIEHRATWMYLLMDEARKEGLDWDSFARRAICRCGHFHGAQKVDACPDVQDLTQFYPYFINEDTEKALEVEVLEKTEDYLHVAFHYCPLVAAWEKQGATPEEIAHLCDIAMDGDRGIAAECGLDFTIEDKIAEGAEVCRIAFRSKK
ncbi:MAG: L-2-amino-thiazoline-4-carboxylic acid hydrolase [Firmicutes bacterium]|nr:L-2-amino-thiazoline-4-carboxylic acid hydrolase [Bacillota bacterium]